MRNRAYLFFLQLGLACWLSSLSLLANAALFGDDEARRAILDLRQRLETTQQNLKSQTAEMVKSQAAEIVKSQAVENANLRGNLLELQNRQFERPQGRCQTAFFLPGQLETPDRLKQF